MRAIRPHRLDPLASPADAPNCATRFDLRTFPAALVALSLIGALGARPAFGWGDEGHEIIGLIAEHDLDPAIRDQVVAMLIGDPLSLTTGKDIASEATWADKYRDSDRTSGPRYTTTHNWHFVDIEIDGPDLDAACFGHPALPSGTPASNAPSNDCVTDKINEFVGELRAPYVDPDERRMALQFLLHFVGDVHQPLHASDNHDKGGNDEKIATHPLPGGNLHHYWDTEFVEQLGTDPSTVANTLLAQITDADRTNWRQGSPEDWAHESFGVAQALAYGALPSPTSTHHYSLPQSYVDDATAAVALQLKRAGVRLAWVLNNSLSTTGSVCTPAVLGAALPSLSTIAGSTVSGVSTTNEAAAVSRAFFVDSSLTLDPNDPNGLPASLEGMLASVGWTKIEAVSGQQIYASQWVVRIAGCGQVTGTATLDGTVKPNLYRGRIELVTSP